MLISIIVYHLIPLLWTLGSQDQRKANPVSFIFSHTFHLIRMKFDVVMEQFKLNMLRLLLSKIYETRVMTAVLQTTSKNFNIGMHTDVCKWI